MSSGFISESEILEARRRRQEEWEKVRTEDQPTEAPEEVFDNRPLYQRLEEQRLRKEAEYEETHKLKNMIRGLDDDEVGFLDLVEETKAKAARQISLEEQKEMQEFRERVSVLSESEQMSRLRAQLAPTRTLANNSHANTNKLQGVVVRKRKASEIENENKCEDGVVSSPKNGAIEKRSVPLVGSGAECGAGGAMAVVGVLPGLGHYCSRSDTSDSDSTDSEIDTTTNLRDILGCKLQSQAERDAAATAAAAKS